MAIFTLRGALRIMDIVILFAFRDEADLYLSSTAALDVVVE